MLRTRAKEFLCTLRRSRASDIDKMPALQPIPERLKLLILLLNPNLLIIIVAKDGVGHTRLQFVMIMSTLFGSIPVLGEQVLDYCEQHHFHFVNGRTQGRITWKLVGSSGQEERGTRRVFGAL
ncbi:hypothetical protein OIU79_023406 [Salix purpurea]|uniref:Uncharacterized protein n=1 Tax=Salix purpurea TaxID=77065 RepID=A0A9Q1A9B0_SALPP|nr:hypothetical protein OIU79_023406 [Salix purpurea]